LYFVITPDEITSLTETRSTERCLPFVGNIVVSFYDLFTVRIYYTYSLGHKIKIYPQSLQRVLQNVHKLLGDQPVEVKRMKNTIIDNINFVDCRNGHPVDRCESGLKHFSYSMNNCPHHNHHKCATHVYRWLHDVVQVLIMHKQKNYKTVAKIFNRLDDNDFEYEEKVSENQLYNQLMYYADRCFL